MRYFFYTSSNDKDSNTVIIIDENSNQVKLSPHRSWGYSIHKHDWIEFYDTHRRKSKSFSSKIFEICENQYKKFVEKGIKPEDWDW